MRSFSFYVVLLGLLLPVRSGDAALWNQVVALLNDTVITAWDIKREIQVERVKKGLQPTDTFSKDDLKVMTKKIIVESLVVAEAKGFGVADIGTQADRLAWEQFQRKFSSEGAYLRFLKEHDIHESELREMLTRSLRVEQFIKEKILSVHIEITDEEIRNYRAAHRGLTDRDVRDRLKKKKIQVNLEDWIQSLKLRNDIRTYWE